MAFEADILADFDCSPAYLGVKVLEVAFEADILADFDCSPAYLGLVFDCFDRG